MPQRTSPGVAAALALYGAALVGLVLIEPRLLTPLVAAGWGAALLVAGLREPLVALYALALAVTVFPKDQVLVDLGLAVTMDRLLAALLGAGLALRLRREGWPPIRVPLAAPALALLVLAGLGLLHSLRPLEAALQHLYNLGLGLLVLAATGTLVDRPSRARRVARILCLAAAYVALLGLWETWNGRYIFPYEALHYRGGLLRAASTLGNPVPLGAYLACAAPLCWMLTRTARARWERRLLGLCLGLILAGLALSFSRQGYLALLAAGLSMLAARHGASGLALGLSAGLVAAVSTLGLWLGPVAAVFFDRDAVSNILHRLYMNRVALELLLESPLLGAGLGSFRPLAFEVQPFGGLKSPHYGEFPSAHNSYLTLGAELGVPGLIAYLVLVGSALAAAARAAGSTRGEEQDFHRARLGALVAYAIGALFLDSHEYLALYTVFCFCIGLDPRSFGGRHGEDRPEA
jgi:O-antigen ligase